MLRIKVHLKSSQLTFQLSVCNKYIFLHFLLVLFLGRLLTLHIQSGFNHYYSVAFEITVFFVLNRKILHCLFCHGIYENLTWWKILIVFGYCRSLLSYQGTFITYYPYLSYFKLHVCWFSLLDFLCSSLILSFLFKKCLEYLSLFPSLDNIFTTIGRLGYVANYVDVLLTDSNINYVYCCFYLIKSLYYLNCRTQLSMLNYEQTLHLACCNIFQSDLFCLESAIGTFRASRLNQDLINSENKLFVLLFMWGWSCIGFLL